MKEKLKLGEMLVEGGLLTDEQLKQAVIGHKKNKMKLGQFLVREGIVSGGQIVDLVSRQLQIKKYQPDKYPIDMESFKDCFGRCCSEASFCPSQQKQIPANHCHDRSYGHQHPGRYRGVNQHRG